MIHRFVHGRAGAGSLGLRGAAAAAAALVVAASAAGQLAPDRLYYGKDRPIPMTVKQPAGVSGELSILLLAPPAADGSAPEIVGTAPVKAGKVDLAALFPMIWKPDGAPTLMYAQLAAGGKKAGPAVVVQPMTALRYANFDPREAKGWRWYDPPAPAYSGVRAYVDKFVVLETTEGDITYVLRPDQAPNTCFNFLHLVEGGFYTGVKFHRIVNTTPGGHPFVIQSGDPAGTGEGGPGYAIDLEPSALPHDFGVISMARTPDPNSAGSQFFICLSREAVVPLDGNYTAFGHATSGADVIQRIASTPVNQETGQPEQAPVIKRAYTMDAAPYGEAPPPVKRPQTEAPKDAPKDGAKDAPR